MRHGLPSPCPGSFYKYSFISIPTVSTHWCLRIIWNVCRHLESCLLFFVCFECFFTGMYFIILRYCCNPFYMHFNQRKDNHWPPNQFIKLHFLEMPAGSMSLPCSIFPGETMWSTMFLSIFPLPTLWDSTERFCVSENRFKEYGLAAESACRRGCRFPEWKFLFMWGSKPA